jgi:2-oxoglutarate dehydrogenase E1 component
MAVVGFEYGYSVVAPRALVLWEAQFGDFVNSAQVIIDQFLVAGREKWGQLSRLVLLLPHAFEGQGPEHSSARLERFLQSCAEDNMRVANCTTPAQYFHILRRQAINPVRRPLIVMTPKSLLRHPAAVSPLDEFTSGAFQRVIDDGTVDVDSVKRVALCTGKICYDLIGADAAEGRARDRVAIVRVEELYPFPREELKTLLDRYGDAELVWVQEEPRNMGAWSWVESSARRELDIAPRYIGRPERASPAEGHAADHEREQNRIIDEALSIASVDGPARDRPATSRQRGR